MFKFLRDVTGFRSLLRRHDCISKFSTGALEDLSDKNPREIILRKLGRSQRKTFILTLDPNKFAKENQQRLRLGNKKTMTPYVSLLNQSNAVIIPLLNYIQTYQISTPTRTRHPFPPDTNAFLYYFMPPEKPRIAGELRLRVTSSDDPASFESGSDLLRPDGQPWSRPLSILPKHYPPLYEKLREEGFVPDDLDRVLLTLPITNRYTNTNRHHLYTLNDTFIVDFGNFGSFLFITEQAVETRIRFAIFLDYRKKFESESLPFTGSALARFERSTLPEHNGTRTVVLRFLKLITPVKCVIPDYDGHICLPKEGELYQRKKIGHKDLRKVWSFNIDESKSDASTFARGLQLLWDA